MVIQIDRYSVTTLPSNSKTLDWVATSLAAVQEAIDEHPKRQQAEDAGLGWEGRIIGNHEGAVWSVAVTPGGQVVSGGTDGTVRLWGLDGGPEREPLGRHESRVLSVAVTPGGQVVSGGDDGTVRLWDLDGGTEREPLGRHEGQVWSVAVTPGGQVVSGGLDGTVRLWDLDGGAVREPLGRHGGQVFAVAVTEGGQVVSGGEDGTVRVWERIIEPTAALDVQPSATSDWATDQDLLGFDALVKGLGAVLNHPNTGLPLAIAVTAPWGAGKSSVMLQLKKLLMKEVAQPSQDRRRWFDPVNYLTSARSLSRGNFRRWSNPMRYLMGREVISGGHGRLWFNPMRLLTKAEVQDGGDRRRRFNPMRLLTRAEFPVDGGRRWYTVDFPAWRYERSERLWTALSKAIYDVHQTQIHPIGARVWFRLTLEWSRLGGWPYVAKSFGPPAVALGVALGFYIADAVTEVWASVGGGGGIVLAGLTLERFSGIVGSPFKRSVNAHASRPRSEERLGYSAEAERDIQHLMMKLAPMDQTSKANPNQAIAVFVDDLDRCSPKYVVEVIEAINQIFNSVNAQCVFILGMDQQVVANSIEVAYLDLVEYLQRKNVPLADGYGYRFLAKIVQITVSVPSADLSGMQRLLSNRTGSEIPVEKVSQSGSADEFPSPATVASTMPPPPREVVVELEQRMREVSLSNPVDVRRRRQELEAEDSENEVRRRALDEIERSMRAGLFTADSRDVRDVEYAALKFLDTNPRQVVRFDNAFRLQLHVASQLTTGTLDFTRPQMMALAKWVAIRLRWPKFAEELDRDDNLLAALERYAYGEMAIPTTRVDSEWLNNSELLDVLSHQEVPATRLADMDQSAWLRVA
ncbi:MAG: hypothetical protein IH872_05150 [Chloroflexi bacterium]|nr:hypothetical protein [Chloroflexota bacterium]